MTTLLILSGFYIIWLAALLTVAYTPRLFHNYTLFKAINSILFVVISVLAWRHSGMNMFTYWPLLAAFCLAAFGDIAIGVANNRHGAAGASHSISGMAGVGFFSIAHVFYLLFFTQFCAVFYHPVPVFFDISSINYQQVFFSTETIHQQVVYNTTLIIGETTILYFSVYQSGHIICG